MITDTKYFNLVVYSPLTAKVEDYYFTDRGQAESAAVYLSGPYGGYEVGIYPCKHSDIAADRYITNWAQVL